MCETMQPMALDDLEGAFLSLGDDSPARAMLAYDILSKSINYSELVRVQRMVSRNGKTYATHMWVRPDQVKKNDRVIAGKETLSKWSAEKAHKASGDAQQTGEKSVPGWNGKLNEMSADTMRALHKEALGRLDASTHPIGMKSMHYTAGPIYHKYGYDAVVAYATAVARELFEYDEWAGEWDDTETRYDPALLAMVRYEWTNKDYGRVRYMEKQALTDKSDSDQVYFKMCNDVLNDMVETDGKPPSDVLYRGLAAALGDLSEFMDAEVGGTITLGAVSSFSGDAEKADEFLEEGDGVILRLEAGDTLKSLFVGGIDETEDEYLVMDGPFEVIDRELEDDEWGKILTLTIRPVDGSSEGE